MGVITLKIDDELERLLRRRVGQKGASRGALSKGVEEALGQWLGVERRHEARVFVALRGDAKVCEDATLAGLAEKLRKMNVDPRAVVIESVPPPPPVVRMGLRTGGLA
ncbi:MAG: hypothetical protein JRN29_05855 [Nitrososphaerota archaeon]|nr:hypothetical protein [Nitrososphaerota archaeon]